MEMSMATLQGRMRVKSAGLQVPMEEEVNLERQMPDVDHVVGQTFRFYKEQVHVGEGKTTVQGSVVYRILYVPVGGTAQLCSVTGSLPFVQSLLLEKEQGWEVEITVDINDYAVKRLNSRKLSVFVMLAVKGEAYCTMRQDYVTDVEGEVEKRFATMPYSRLLQHGTTAASIKECISLAENRPDISRILFEEVELHGVELIPAAGQLKMRGELALFLVYQPEEPDTGAQYLTVTQMVEETCDYPGSGEEAIAAMHYQIVLADVKEAPNEDGRMRDLHVSVEMEIAYDVYENGEFTCVTDAYSKEEQVILAQEEYPILKGMSGQLLRAMVEERFSPDAQERLLAIYPVGARVLLETPEILEGELLVEGMVVCTLLYLGMTGVQPTMAELSIPFHQMVHQPAFTAENLSRVQAQVWGDLADFHVAILDGTQAEVKASVNLTVQTYEKAECCLVTGMSKIPYESACGPGMVGVIVSGKDQLWELAKENRTTIDAILRINDVEEEKIQAGMPLLVCQNL